MGGEQTNSIAASSEMQEYFQNLQEEIDNCYRIAEEARKKGFDPETKVEIPQALDLAARVEQLVGPKNIAPKIRSLSKKIKNRELVSIEIAKEIVKLKKYKKKEQALDQAIRTGLAILTEGVLVAPLEGIVEVKIGQNKDQSQYLDLYFSGPIRSAGGTGQALSVLIADVVRRELQIDRYKPTEGEIERYKEEIPLYKRAQHLQYTPSVDEIDRIIRNCPICVNGEGTEDVEVTGYRDLPRIQTNRLRGGACLVIAEGLCLKAPKILKHVKKLKIKEWEFLDIFVNKEKQDKEKKQEIAKIPANKKYIGEVIAGRPVFSHPSRKGGFRLRYGRARTAGLASTAINPASMQILDEFLAVGTQIKTERPGKGTIGTPCTSIEGPIVLLQNGDLVQYNTMQKINKAEIKKIIDLGEILIPYGEFLENNSLLPDSSYVYEWWIQDLQKKLKIKTKNQTVKDIQRCDEQTQEILKDQLKRKINLLQPDWQDALEISKKYNIPLHPYYNLFWHDLTVEEILFLKKYTLEKASIKENNLTMPQNPEIKKILIDLGALHKQRQENIVILQRYTDAIIQCLGLQITQNKIKNRKQIQADDIQNPMELVEKLADIKIQPRAPFRIGTRMGRPEKAAARKMRPPPHVLFPIGNYGGNQRLIRNAAEKPNIEVEVGMRICPKCKKKTHKLICQCKTHTIIDKTCRIETINIDLHKELQNAQKNVKERTLPDTIKGVIGTISAHKTPEPLEKGILRAKHNVHVFKDGTIRFDMTDAPLTHFKPKEIHVSVDRLKQLGYTKDYKGEELRSEDQICELKVQDVIISKSCAEYFTQVTKFLDEILLKLYNMDRFYKIKKLENLTGHLTIGLAPHTSAGSLSRIVGFTDSQVCYGHPFYHASKRRNCLVPDTNIVVIDNNTTNITTLEKLYNSTLSQEKIVDDYYTLQKNLKNVKTYAFNSVNGKIEIKKIKSIIKAKSPKHLLKTKLKSGRTYISSPNHRTLTLSNNHIMIKKAVESQTDDNFFLPKKIYVDVNDIKEIDLLFEFTKNKRYDDIVIRGIKNFTMKCTNRLGGLKSTAKMLNINKKTFSNYLYRDSIPINLLFKLLKLCNIDKSNIPKNATLGIKRDHTHIPRIIKINREFMRLIGYYIS